VFVAALDSRESPLWSEPVWMLPATAKVRPGSFLFTTDAELIGLAIEEEGVPIVVPGPRVLAEAHRLLAASQGEPATLGVEVQTLTQPLAAVTGASHGVVVAWAAPGGNAAALAVGDVIEAIDDRPVPSQRHWDVFVSRLKVGDTSTLRVRRRGESRTVTVEASPVAPAVPDASLGLALRAMRGVGAEVIRVERRSAGDRSGLTSGDVITLIGETPAPTPRQVARAFAALDAGERLMMAVTRHQSHVVLVLKR
jgi:S1-C subfamily serine protease